jgi:phospholipid/cholesterol/gamma-HCH transport system permease protein
MDEKSGLSATIEKIGEHGHFLFSAFRHFSIREFDWSEFIRQCYNIGYKSLGIVLVTGFVLGFVLTLQSIPTLKQFGAQSYVPGMVAVSVIREIGPVITALICTGKIASGIGAELGSMRVTEQIDAMEVSGANALLYLVATRILACTLMVPLLTLIADGMAFVGGYAGVKVTISMTFSLYFTKMFAALRFSDLIPAVIKSYFFGFTIGFVGCMKGYYSNRGTESVGRAANMAVVTASIWIIILDAVAVELTNALVYSK